MNDGGPAFPTKSNPGLYTELNHDGMSLRDWFAGQALVSIVRSKDRPYLESDDAAWSYRVADAMLAQRDKKS